MQIFQTVNRLPALKDPVEAGIRGIVRFAEWKIEETLGGTGCLEPWSSSLRLLELQSSRQSLSL